MSTWDKAFVHLHHALINKDTDKIEDVENALDGKELSLDKVLTPDGKISMYTVILGGKLLFYLTIEDFEYCALQSIKKWYFYGRENR